MPEKKFRLNLLLEDDEDEDKASSDDSLSTKYKMLTKIGEGSYSEVLKCRHRETGVVFACKRLKHRYRGWKRVNDISEVVTLRKLPRHPNILQMVELNFDARSGRVSLIFELMEMNLYELIKDRKRLLSESRVRVFLFQLLRGLRHLHKNGVFHRDVKPENILLETKTDILKLGDLGSVRGLYSKPPYTEYISTRWYRSPECLLTTGFYNYKMDVWAAGCVFYEILTLRPLFPGASEIDQISRIHQILGPPPSKILKRLTEHSEMSRKLMHRTPKPGRRESITKILCQLQGSEKKSSSMSSRNSRKYFGNIEKLLPNHVNRDGIELLRALLEYDPDNRPSAHRALQHPYFDDLRHTARSYMNKMVSYSHPLMSILGPEFLHEMADEHKESKLNLKTKEMLEEEESFTDLEFIEEKSSRKSKQVDYFDRNASVLKSKKNSVVSEEKSYSNILDNESETKKLHVSNKEKQSKIVADVMVDFPQGDFVKESLTKNESRLPRLSKRPPIPSPAVESLTIKKPRKTDNSESPSTIVSSIPRIDRKSFRSLSEISLMDDFPKGLIKEALTKSDLKKINEGRRMVQMLPIGQTDIRKSVLATDTPSPLIKSTVSSKSQIPVHKKTSSLREASSEFSSSNPTKPPSLMKAVQSIHMEHAHKLKLRQSAATTKVSLLPKLYPPPKYSHQINTNRQNIKDSNNNLNISAVGAAVKGSVPIIHSRSYKMPIYSLSSDITEKKVLKSLDQLGRISTTTPPPPPPPLKRIPVPVPHPPRVPPSFTFNPMNAEKHRQYLRRRRENVQLSKYKNEISPYAKFFVAEDGNEEEQATVKPRDTTGAGNIRFPRNRFGDTNNNNNSSSSNAARVTLLQRQQKLKPEDIMYHRKY